MGLRALNYISLCAGGGGLDLGIELADPGARPVVLVEREAFSCAVLVDAMEQGRLAPAPVWTDVRTFDGRPWRGLVDGVIGGIPCQPHSVAGRQLGEEDERDLWSDARRIIVQSGAWWCLIENVPGMLSSGGAERIWRDLSRLGFEVEGGLFSAEEVGASHGRERLFILAVADASGAGLQGGEWREPSGEWHGPLASGPASELRGASMVHPASVGRGKGGAEPELWGGRGSASGASDQMADAIGSGHHRRPDDALGRPVGGDAAEGTVGRLFAPGPDDRDAWLAVLDAAPHLAPAVEPDVRGMADGMAHRVDCLRMLGNGVVPLQAAYAYRTLVARLAERSPAAATLAVRMSA